MTNHFPYAVHMLNLGKFAYMHQICLRLKSLAAIKEDTSDMDFSYLKEELEREIREIEEDACERYTDWATD